MQPESGFLCKLHILPHTKLHDLHAKLQAGKTRLDHFLVRGRKFDYLFVSSPYGSNGSIESIIAGMKRATVHGR